MTERSLPLAAAAVRALLFAGVWWVLAGGEVASWGIGVPAVLVATGTSLAVAPPGRALRPLGVLAFLPWFLWHSLRGGLDVALRSFHPRLPIAPGIVPYTMTLPLESRAGLFFVGILGLLPGTICARADSATLQVHVIDVRRPVAADLAALEARVAALFGEPR